MFLDSGGNFGKMRNFFGGSGGGGGGGGGGDGRGGIIIQELMNTHKY